MFIGHRKFEFIVDEQYLDKVPYIAHILYRIMEHMDLTGKQIKVPSICILERETGMVRGAYYKWDNQVHLYPKSDDYYWCCVIETLAHEMMHWYRTQVSKEFVRHNDIPYKLNPEEIAARKYADKFYAVMLQKHVALVDMLESLDPIPH
jgi:hypothetical protein